MMKRNGSILLIALLFLGTFGFAQSAHEGEHSCQGDPEEHAERRTEKLSELLKLSDEQEKQIHALLRDHMEEMHAHHQKGDDADRGEMKSLRKNIHEGIKEVLNDDQTKKFQKHVEKKRAMREHHRELQEARKELRPEMKEKRVEFEEQLDDEEKETLAELREAFPDRDGFCSFGGSCQKGGMCCSGASCQKGGSASCCKRKKEEGCSHGKHGHGKEEGHKKSSEGHHGAMHEGKEEKLEPVYEIVQEHEEELRGIVEEMYDEMNEKVGEAPHSEGQKESGSGEEADPFKGRAACFLLMSPEA